MNTLKSLFTDIIDLVGKRTDLAAKYEGSYKPDADGNEGMLTELDDHESADITGEKIATVANFAKDKTINETLDAFEEKLPEILAAWDDLIAALRGSNKDMRLALLALIKQQGGDIRISKKDLIAADSKDQIRVSTDPASGAIILTVK